MVRRLCHVVIEQMLKHVPEEQVEFIAALKWNQEDSSYKAPEENIQWERTMFTLQEYIPAPIQDWEYQVLSIFTTRSIDELKFMVELEANNKK